MKTALSIAGSDSCGGAGIQADVKTMTMNGVYAMTAITALTAQNTTGVRSIMEATPQFLKEQIDAVFEDIRPDSVKIGMVSSAELIQVIADRLAYYNAKNIVVDPVMVATSGSKLMRTDASVKIGMVSSAELIQVIADRLAYYNAKNIVVDPVMVATSGSKLMRTDAVSALTSKLMPLAVLVTPNITEAEALSDRKIDSKADMEQSAKIIGDTYGCAVLLKGGHHVHDANDLFYTRGHYKWFYGKRIHNPNTHGTGCTLSSAIAANLAKGYELDISVQRAK